MGAEFNVLFPYLNAVFATPFYNFENINALHMLKKNLLITFIVLLALNPLFSQRVKRKGVTPIDVSKNKRLGEPETPVFTSSQFVGKWQEIVRSYKGKASMRYSDTIYLNFISNTKVTTKRGMESSMEGEVAIDNPGNILLAAADVYTIVSVNNDTALLDDQEDYVHTFIKVPQFNFENFGKNVVKQDEYTTPITATLSQLLGKWSVYKKTAKPGVINPPTNIISYIKISQKTGENSATGEVSFYQTDQTKNLPCTIKISGTNMNITAGNNTWNLLVYKTDAKEFVFGDANVLLYFAKPL